MVSITNVSIPGNSRFDGSSSQETSARDAMKDGRQALALPAEARQETSSKIEYRASTSESLQYRGYKVFKRAVYANETLKLFQPKFKTPQPDPAAAAPVKTDSAAYLGSKQSPVQTATNILGFIEQRLTDRKAEGASDVELDSLLQQAREGIDKGFEQARADLEKLGLMTEELSGEIDQSYDLALNGLETLKVTFGLAEPAPQTVPDSNQAVPVANTPEPTSSTPVSDAKTQVDASSGKTLESSRLSYQSGMRGSLMITTRDGDKVYLDETLIESLRYKSVTRSDGSYERFSAASQYTQELRVVGSLDEDEMSAIQDLVDKASEIAGLMQSDDFQSALEQAMALEFDTSEIASFALQLTRVEVFTSKSVVYKKPTPMPAFAPVLSQIDRKISEVVSLLDQLKISNSEFAEFIAQRVPANRQNQESSSKQVQAFQAITEQLLNLHRGVDRDSFEAL